MRIDAGRHEGRRAIVTGAGSGIGRATAIRLAREGAHVIANDVNAARLEALAAELAGAKLDLVRADIAVRQDADRLVAEAARHGRIDILANVAGVFDGFLAVHEVSDEEWQRVIAVNLTAPMMLCRAVLPLMRAAGGGAIVSVASIAGLRGAGAGAAYTASKHGLVGLTQNIAWMYRHEGIRCNAVCPGGVSTDIRSSLTTSSDWGAEQLKPFMGSSVRGAEPDEIAAVISWLASDEASNVNGAILPADAGWMTA